MSITDELREFASHCAGGMGGDALTNIADRIDAEHQKAEDEWKVKDGQTWLRGYAECHAELMEGNEVIAADLEKAGWVCLPKDADGEVIRPGDELVTGIGILMGQVTGVGVGKRKGWVWTLLDGDNLSRAHEASVLHHHHEPTVQKPTVEDVLRDVVTLCHNTWKEGSADGFYDVDDVMNSGNIAEYTKRIREVTEHERD